MNERLWTLLPIVAFSLLVALLLWRFLSSPSGASPYATGSGTGDAVLDRDVAALVNALSPAHKRKLAVALDHWHHSVTSEPNIAHSGIVSGPANAPLHVTAWVDVECSGSRELVASLARLRARYPSDVRVDVRSFPRRESCVGGQSNVRCLTALTRACLAGTGTGPSFDDTLFARANVSPAALLDLAQQHMDRAKLTECLSAPTTLERVQAWLGEGKNRGIKDTPLVLANGRHADRFYPLLELLVLTRGSGVHPALRELPSAR